MKSAVVLMNLGTPTEPTKKAVRAFLKEFLSDRRVVEIPKVIWMVILYMIILNFRVPRVTKAYQKIWAGNESPLRKITRGQASKLQLLFNNTYANAEMVPQAHYAMTYSGPSLAATVKQLEQDGFEHILVLPLYPQFSATTTGSIYDQISQINQQRRNIPQIHVVKQYFDHPLYIGALANSIRQQWQTTGKPDKLLMSFHSIPQSYSDAGDPYYQQCLATADLLAEALELQKEDWSISFQSRLGFAKWLSPYTSETLKKWGQENIKHVDVVCPAFAADCLETLEEIEDENRELFMASGGENFNLIPCLNEDEQHIAMMAAIADKYLPK
ncbi:ferrochelatase [Oceanicoccus sagamiensis]|uniref:Ferrochelatase n=1 Tax=Oceanicoccus sagamiensis TaxID=716816 RepID=A0A1X9NN95_9GAMM|nr:ferrochelatase [Oceanicoccus sagamiensis]ARN75363.1 ferrochelatase [Oceanicoccus sagamiensis]